VDELEQSERLLLESLRSGDLDEAASRLRDDFLITTAGWVADPAGKQAWLDAVREQMTLIEAGEWVLAVRHASALPSR
jgi:hypothetical protein